MNERRDQLINLNLVLLAIIASVAVLVIAWRVLEVVFPVLVLLLVAMLLAFLLDSFVGRLEAANVNRGVAVAVVYLALLTLIFGLGGLLITPLIGQIGSLATDFPSDVHQAQRLVNRADRFLAARHIPVHLKSMQHQGLAYAQHAGQTLLGSTLDIVQSISHIVIDILAVIVMSLYLLIDGPRIRHNILRLAPEGHRSKALLVEVALRTVVGGYVRGQLLLALTIGLMAAGGCWALGVPYPLVIGLVAGFFELVPMLGPILGALPAVGLAALQSFQLAIATVILFVVIQQLEAHVIAPRIMGHAVGVHPVVAILAVLLGAELDGIFGALVAVPVAGIVYVLGQVVYAQVSGQQHRVEVVHRRPIYFRLVRRLRAHTTSERDEGTIRVTVEAPSQQLAEIVHERDVLADEFERAEKEAQETAAEILAEEQAERTTVELAARRTPGAEGDR